LPPTAIAGNNAANNQDDSAGRLGGEGKDIIVGGAGHSGGGR
jgi:hypothetical protein